VVNSQFNSINY